MKATEESGINKDLSGKSTDWNATAGKTCTDVFYYHIKKGELIKHHRTVSDVGLR